MATILMKDQKETDVPMILSVMGIEDALIRDGVKELQDDLNQTYNITSLSQLKT